MPATDRPSTLERCLAAIATAVDPPDEVIVVTEPAGSGPAKARNIGVSQTDADVVVFVDSDVLVHADSFARIRRAFAENADLVAVLGSYDDRVATANTVAAFRNLLHHVVHQRSAGDVGSFWAGLGAVRRSAFDAVGGFDAARYPAASIEDIELGDRLARQGRIILDPQLLGTHLKEWTLTSMVRADFSSRGVPWVGLLVERRSLPRTLNLGTRERASAAAVLALCFAVLSRRPAVAAAAIGAEVALNRDLFALLHRRLGLPKAATGLGLHAVHQLTAMAAVPAGLVAATRR